MNEVDEWISFKKGCKNVKTLQSLSLKEYCIPVVIILLILHTLHLLVV